MPGAYWSSSHVEAPGIISSAGRERVSFGEERGGASNRSDAISDVFDKAGIEVELSQDALQVIWSKFVVLSSAAGISSAAGTRIKRFIERPQGLELFIAAVQEADAVGRAKGVNLPEDTVEQSVGIIESLPDFQYSMHTDIEHGRRTELDALSGAVVRLGLEAGVPTPVHSFIYTVLLPHKNGGPG